MARVLTKPGRPAKRPAASYSRIVSRFTCPQAANEEAAAAHQIAQVKGTQMRTLVTLTALGAAVTATPALAQQGGLYVGAIAGYEGIDVDAADGSVSADADSAVYGINAGYDLSLGSLFVGV